MKLRIYHAHLITLSCFREGRKLKTLAEIKNIAIQKDVCAAIAQTDVVFLSIPYSALKQVYTLQHDLKKKVLISCVNALRPDLPGSSMGLRTSRKISVAEELQQRLPDTFVGRSV